MPKVPYTGGATLVSYDAEWAASKSQKEFIAHEKHNGLSNEQLIEAHNLCKAAVKAPAKVSAEDSVPGETNS
jgi:hypothetical protein